MTAAAGTSFESLSRLFGHKRALTRREKRRLIGRVTGAVFAAVGLMGVCQSAGIWINTTDSMPRGLWRETEHMTFRPGDVVLLCLPATPVTKLAKARGYIGPGPCPTGQELLLKPIAAAAGDMVTVSSGGISVNDRQIANSGQLAHDSQGRQLPNIAAGVYRVPSGQIWLVSSHNPRSFDSRYFGSVSVALVRSTVRPFWVFD